MNAKWPFSHLLFLTIILLISQHLSAQWQKKHTIDGGKVFSDIQFVDSQNGYAISTSGYLHRTIDGGNSWLDSVSVTSLPLMSMQFINADTGYVLDYIGNLHKTINHGNSWNLLYQFNGSTALFFVDKSVGYIANGYNQLFKTTNGGLSWSLMYVLNSPINAIYFTDQNTGLIAAYDIVYKTADGGITWVGIPSLPGVSMDGEMLFTNQLVGYACLDSMLYKTIDGGDNWLAVSNFGSNSYMGSIFFVDDTLGYISQYWPSSLVFKTSNGGSYWDTLNYSFPDTLSSLYFISADTGFVTASRYIFKTESGGQLTNVWPGDADANKAVDVYDLLNIGIAYGENGPIRSSASLVWIAQPASDWGKIFSNGVDYKHADCDGNGIVNADDTTAILLNYGQSHLKVQSLMEQTSGSVMYLGIPSGPISKGTKLTIPIYLGTSSNMATNAYGLAFNISYDSSLIYKDSISISFSNSWLGTTGLDLLNITKNLPQIEQIDIATTRTDLSNKSGYGIVGELNIVTSDNISGKINLAALNLSINNAKMISADETIFTVTIDSTLTNIMPQRDTDNKITLYPNPSNNYITINNNGVIVQSIQIVDLLGQSKLKFNLMINQSLQIDLTNFATGIYLLQLETNKGMIVKKFSKQ